MPRTRIDPIIPSEQDAALAETARRTLEQRDAAGKPLHLSAGGHELDLPPVVTRLLLDILKETAAGRAVALVPVEAEITTQQAADLLNVSRPFLIGMIDKGVLPARMVGNQRRLPLKHVLAYKADHFAERRTALDQLVAYDQGLGLE
jgi:excisionase family DNA binding protein